MSGRGFPRVDEARFLAFYGDGSGCLSVEVSGSSGAVCVTTRPIRRFFTLERMYHIGLDSASLLP